MSFFGTVAFYVLAFIFLSYLIPHCIVALLKPRDLKRAYDAKWGLVTGASSGELPLMHTMLHLHLAWNARLKGPCACAGIGKSLATKLASQGMNVVLVALQDGLIDATFAELKAQFPQQTFRKVRLLLFSCIQTILLAWSIIG